MFPFKLNLLNKIQTNYIHSGHSSNVIKVVVFIEYVLFDFTLMKSYQVIGTIVFKETQSGVGSTATCTLE